MTAYLNIYMTSTKSVITDFLEYNERQKMTYKKWDMEYNVIDLQKYGIKNFAFDLPSAVSYMYEAVSNGFLILGGDIIVNDHGIFVESVDGWYSEKNTPLDTMQDALNYLCLYWNNCKMKAASWYITIVLSK